MNCYRVEVKTTGREIYLVDAESEDEALANWHEGELLISEVYDADPNSVTEES